MNAQLIKRTEERGYRARADRRIQQVRVVAVNTSDHTIVGDTGAVDSSGTPIYLTNITYSPQVVPKVNDVYSILYTNSSPHSATVGGLSLGGVNQTIDNGGVMSIRKTGSTKLTGDVTVTPGSGVTITQVGKDLSFASSAALAIGASISGGTATRILFEDTGPVLADSSALTFDSATKIVRLTMPSSGNNIPLVVRRTTTSAFEAIACYSAELQSSVALTAGAATGILFAIAGSGGTPVYVSAVLGGFDTNATSGCIDFWTGLDTGGGVVYTSKVHLSREGNLSFTPATGAYGLRLPNVTSASVTSPNAGSIVYDTGVVKFYNGSVWKTLADTSQITGIIPHVVINLAFNSFSWLVPAAITEWNARIEDRVQVDLTNATQARITLCEHAVPASSGADIRCQYYTGAAWAYLDGVAGPSVNVGTAGNLIASAWVTLVAGAKADVKLRIVGINGNATSCVFGTIQVQVK